MKSTSTNRRVLLVSADDLTTDILTRLVPSTFEVTRSRTTLDAKAVAAKTEFGVLFFDESASEVSTREICKSLLGGPNAASSRIALLDPGQRSEVGPLIDSCDLFACLVAPWENDALVLSIERAAEFSALRRDTTAGLTPMGANPVPATDPATDPALLRAIARAFV